MSVSELSTSAQNHLKVIWGLQEWSSDPVTPSTIAAKAGLRLSTVSGALTKLAERGLVEHERYGGSVRLTPNGRALALQMVRRHRLIETFLVEKLGYGWDQVHEEAEHVEHAVSDLLVERLDEFLGRPRRDPHGDPIPSAAGEVELPKAILLSEAAPGHYTVERIADDDPELLRYFSEQGIDVGAVLRVTQGAPWSETVTVALAARDPLLLGRSATGAVRVSPA